MGPALFDSKTTAVAARRDRDPGARDHPERREDPARPRPSAISSSPTIIDQVLGYGPIERYLADPAVSEMMVNGLDGIFVERNGKLIVTDASSSPTSTSSG